MVFPSVTVDMRRDLYLADAETLWQAVEQTADEADTLIVVAHNPGIHELAARLLRRDGGSPSAVAKVERGFPTATAAIFLIDDAGRAMYDGLILASEHGGGAGE